MEDEWDADDFEPPAPVTAVAAVKSDKWEGEDEEEQVKESWEDEETEATQETKRPTESAAPAKKKPSERLKEKIAEKERKAREEAEARKRLQEANMTPEERLAEKLRRQQLVEEADLEVAMETFGVSSVKGALDAADPSSKEEFMDFKTNLVRKIQSLSGKTCYSEFIEEFMKEICAGLDVEVLKKVSQTAKSLHEEKQKMAKAASKPGKKGKTKVTLKMDRGIDTYEEDYGGGDYDDFM